jgi:hypothetical protein
MCLPDVPSGSAGMDSVHPQLQLGLDRQAHVDRVEKAWYILFRFAPSEISYPCPLLGYFILEIPCVLNPSRHERWIKIACAFPVSPTVENPRGINGADWIEIDRKMYDSCLDPLDYRMKKFNNLG